jgi:hypothetical protein
MVTPFPFKEDKISEKEIVRKFSEMVDEDDLQWHFDEEDRLVEILEDTDWLIQFDNELPKKIKNKIFIPKHVYHRLIKGTKDCKVKIYKL